MKITLTMFSGGNGGSSEYFEGSQSDLEYWKKQANVVTDESGVKTGLMVNGYCGSGEDKPPTYHTSE